MIWADEDDTAEPEPLKCPDCGAVGDAPCARTCIYADDPGHTLGYVAACADRYHDEQASSDRDPMDGPWADIF